MTPLALLPINSLSEHLLLLSSVLIFLAILISKLGSKFGVPSLLLFLVIGMLAGKDGLGITFDNYQTAESIGNFAMTVILFTAGLETSLKDIKPVLTQGILLSTLGVFLTTVIAGVLIYLIAGGIFSATLMSCFLFAAVMSSTDSASVFSIIRGRRMHLREKLGPMLELESGSNDPMAFSLTIILVQVITMSKVNHPDTLVTVVSGVWVLIKQIAVGAIVGLAIGHGAKWVLNEVKLEGSALLSVLILSVGFFANSIAGILHGNGLLSLYIAAIIIGNKAKITRKNHVLSFFDGVTWLMQLVMFLMLGLLASPSQMMHVVGPALLIGLAMMLIARPASTFICLLPFRKLSVRAKSFASWVGLKGAAPIMFAIYPVVSGVDGSSDMFNMVFIITLFSLLLQGMTLAPMAKWLHLGYDEDPQAETFGMEIPDEMGMMRDHTVTKEDLALGETLRDLSLPHGIRVMMVKRSGKFLVPHGSMKLKVGDRLVIIVGESDD